MLIFFIFTLVFSIYFLILKKMNLKSEIIKYYESIKIKLDINAERFLSTGNLDKKEISDLNSKRNIMLEKIDEIFKLNLLIIKENTGVNFEQINFKKFCLLIDYDLNNEKKFATLIITNQYIEPVVCENLRFVFFSS